MKNRANHIIRSITITCLMAGFLAHLVVPFSSQAQKTAFARWLNYNVVSSGNESEVKLRNTIKELPEQTGDFWGLIQEASELVANHKDHFRISVSDLAQTGEPSESDWLIEQWNSFQNQKSGFYSVLAESIKSLLKWIPQNQHFSTFKRDAGLHQNSFFSELFFCSSLSAIDFVQPLISGISINAP